MYTKETHEYIAVDFDGTIIQDGNYPYMGDEQLKQGAIATLQALVEKGYQISIWTCRGGHHPNLLETQEEAILTFLQQNGLDTTNIKVNEHFDYYLNRYPKSSPKVYASVYIDDRGVGVTEIDWYEIRKLFTDIKWEEIK